MAYTGDQRPVRDNCILEDGGGGGAVPTGSLHALGAGGDGAPVAGGAARGRGEAVPGDLEDDRRLDGDGDEGGALAALRGSRVPLGARSPEAEVEADRLRIAIPVKGRLREPCVALLEDAGLGPERPGERALAFPCRNAPVEVLLVRAADVPEYVQDGVVDCGVTGADLVRERGVHVDELLRLGFGGCTLQAAVPDESPARTLADLAGLRAATVYPRLAREELGSRGIEVELVEVTGSVEITPRLGLADAIVDLVSSGNTLRTNGLRSLGTLFSSEAVLVARPGGDPRADRLATILRTVIDARESRYLMLNAPEDAVDAICAIVPGSGAPSVLPLAQPGMVAVHALVPAKDVWSLLPRLQAAGGSSILLLPVERMLT
jgi:ATP phosphoribosyltransferase